MRIKVDSESDKRKTTKKLITNEIKCKTHQGGKREEKEVKDLKDKKDKNV